MSVNFAPIATGKRIAKRALIAQSIVAFSGSFLLATVFSSGAGIAFLFGSVASVLPNAVFALFAFRFSGAQQNQAVAKSFSQGSKFKFALTMILFVTAFSVYEQMPIYVFAGFIAVTLAQWVSMFRQSVAAK